jgi:hypothetical protein
MGNYFHQNYYSHFIIFVYFSYHFIFKYEWFIFQNNFFSLFENWTIELPWSQIFVFFTRLLNIHISYSKSIHTCCYFNTFLKIQQKKDVIYTSHIWELGNLFKISRLKSCNLKSLGWQYIWNICFYNAYNYASKHNLKFKKYLVV